MTSETPVYVPGYGEMTAGQVAEMVVSTENRSTRTQRNLITRVLDTAGLNGMGRGFHELRHAYARRFLEMAPDILLLQKSLGHSSVTVTESAYGNLVPDTAAALARKRVYG